MKSALLRGAIWARRLLLACLFAMPALAEDFTPIPNPSFDQGSVTPSDSDAPLGWTLSGGKGRWVGRNVLEVTGSGTDSNFWRCDYRFTPAKLYRFQFRARAVEGSGSVIAGPTFANRDYHVGTEWKWYSHVFRVPDDVKDSFFRLGQWQHNGTVQFDAVKLVPVLPAHPAVGDLVLGEGESIRDGRYTFSGTFAHESSNYHRPLHSATAGFNSDRWTFGGDSRVTYCFKLPGHKFTGGEIAVNVNYHIGGACLAEVSHDQTAWRTVATQEKVGTARAELPDDLLPGETIFVRFRASTGDSSFQLNRVEFTADLEGTPPDIVGETAFVDVEIPGSELKFDGFALRKNPRGGGMALDVAMRNSTRYVVSAELVVDPKATGVHLEMLGWPGAVEPGKTVKTDYPLLQLQPGKNRLTLVLRDVVVFKPPERKPGSRSVSPHWVEEPGKAARISLTYHVPEYCRSDYGEALYEYSSRKAILWWCPAAHKIPPQRELPGEPVGADAKGSVRLSAARNDREAVQVVVHPMKGMEGIRAMTATAGAFAGPDGATIPADNVKILRVAYHFVNHPTDATGVRDYWPDALPPLNKPIDVPVGKNQPLWVLVHVPKDAKAGDYSGTISLKAENFSAEVPIELHVWNFTLPDRNHIETAFGFSPGNVFRYHQLKTDEDKRRVLDMYLKCYAEHRISPYNPAPMDPIGVRFDAKTDPPRAELDFSRFDPAMTRAVEQFHFTGIRLPIQGMGGGTFHARANPKIGDFGEETPEYKAMFSSYVKQLEDHFREKGWLDRAYIYWFDEPAPKDYEFVAAGMNRLKQYAPGLRRMLTEEPADNVLAGTVDVWCPVSFNYNHEAAEKRRAHGERFWWYVCCGPKAPYCTLFIDHPATELRTWLWQTWQRKIDGILVWQAMYWTSSAAFPDPARPQNPYEDPMGYVSGYSTPKGTKRFWGNGDGRFVYPPESAAVPGIAGDGPVIEPPVSSIRWEMLREGIEDWEYLYMLRELLAKRRSELTPEKIKEYEALLEVPESITRDMTTFTTDPAPIYRRRSEIAQAIERLQP